MLNDGFAKVWRNKGKLPLLLKVNTFGLNDFDSPNEGGKEELWSKG